MFRLEVNEEGPRFAGLLRLGASPLARGLSEALTNVVEQPLSGLLHQIQHLFEPPCASIVGIGDLSHLALGSEVEKQPQFPAVFLRTLSMQERQIIFIHRQYVVPGIEVVRHHSAGTLPRKFDTPAQRRLLGPLVGRFTDVKRVRAGRVDGDPLAQAFPLYEGLEDALRGRGPTDIAHTNKQHVNFITHQSVPV